MRRRFPRPQTGAAIVTAMLTVAMIATLSSSILWRRWQGVELETAEHTRAQSEWLLTGGLDWARLILREDGRKGGPDYLSEPWSVPLQEARLSTFIAAGQGDEQTTDATQEAFLSGQIVDMQSRLNVSNLIINGQVDEPSLNAFRRLYRLFSLPQEELDRMVARLRLSADPGADPVQRAAAPLWPQDEDQLLWAGMSPATLAVLKPYITVLPERTTVNLNTAPVEVVYACITDFDLADAYRLVRARAVSHLRSLDDAAKASGKSGTRFNDSLQGVTSRFFEVRGRMRLDKANVEERSLVRRDGMVVQVVWRRRGPYSLPELQPEITIQ